MIRQQQKETLHVTIFMTSKFIEIQHPSEPMPRWNWRKITDQYFNMATSCLHITQVNPIKTTKSDWTRRDRMKNSKRSQPHQTDLTDRYFGVSICPSFLYIYLSSQEALGTLSKTNLQTQLLYNRKNIPCQSGIKPDTLARQIPVWHCACQN